MKRRPAVLAAILSDHRWRAVVMGLATALVALVAVALLTGSGSSTHPPKSRTTGSAVTHRTTTPVRPATTTPTVPAPAVNSGPAGPAGHGGKPKGGKKHHAHGGD